MGASYRTLPCQMGARRIDLICSSTRIYSGLVRNRTPGPLCSTERGEARCASLAEARVLAAITKTARPQQRNQEGECFAARSYLTAESNLTGHACPDSPRSEKVHTQLQHMRQHGASHQAAARLRMLRQEEEEAASRARYSRSSTESSDMYLPDLSLPSEYDPNVSRHGRRRTFSQLMAEDAPSAPRPEDKMGQRLSEMLAREQHNSKRQRLEALESRGPPRAAPGKPSANRHGASSSLVAADNSSAHSHLIHVAREVQLESLRSEPTCCPSSGRQSPLSSSSEV